MNHTKEFRYFLRRSSRLFLSNVIYNSLHCNERKEEYKSEDEGKERDCKRKVDEFAAGFIPKIV